MIVDAKMDYKSRRLILIKSDGDVEEIDARPPYFYAMIPREKRGLLERVLGGEGVWLEEDWRTPIIYKGNRYEPDNNYVVYKVYSDSPAMVPQLSENLKKFGVRIAASNVRYIIRNTLDLDVRFFDAIPLYYGFDAEIMKRIRKVKALVIDVEAVQGKPVLVSAYWYSPFEEVRKDDVMSLWLPESESELRRLLARAPIIIGHNVLGFDIPVLKRAGYEIDTLTKSIFDTSVLLATYGSALKVGSARSLLDVATILAKDAGITEEELEIKRRVGGRVEGLSKEEMTRYNVNDVVLTAKLLNIFYPFVAVISALTQIPPSEVLALPGGMVAEYYLLRLIELMGYVPEYRQTEVRLKGERVWLAKEGVEYLKVVQTDVKMMYPTFVLQHYIDPTLHVGNEKFDRKTGVGVVYSAVRRLAEVRKLSKKLKKQDPLYEPLDAGVKAILNALAYGVQGKQSGLAIMGNPWCPSRIFYGTRESQFSTIEYLRKKGYKVVYSDTDSFFIALDNCENKDDCKTKVEELVKEINNFLARYGLEVDVEDVWDKMYIYAKKNYILRKGTIVITKGSALHNLDRYYTPEAVSIIELLKTDDKWEREKLLRDMIMSAPVEDLFIRGHQQVWRLIGKDPQSFKRQKERRERYMRVMTPWAEKPTLVLKKARGGQLYLPHSNPIFVLFLENGRDVDVAELNPFNIVELRSLKVDGEIMRLRGSYRLGDLLVYTDRIYTIKVKELKYGIRQGDKVRWWDMWYEGRFPPRPVGVLVALRADLDVRPVNIEENILRELVYRETRKTLVQYGLL